MSTADLILALRRLADIAGSTDRAAVLAEAADRLESLAADGGRLDFVESERLKLAHEGANGWWYASSAGIRDFYVRDTARQAIDAARGAKSKEDADA